MKGRDDWLAGTVVTAGFPGSVALAETTHVVDDGVRRREGPTGDPVPGHRAQRRKVVTSTQHLGTLVEAPFETPEESWGVEEVCCKILEDIYKDGTATIKLHMESDKIPIKKGGRQGYTISAKLFSACLEEIFKKLDWDGKDIKIGDEYLNNQQMKCDQHLNIFLGGQYPVRLHMRDTGIDEEFIGTLNGSDAYDLFEEI
ncbi:uncharacterized protein [Penaeus vannamei]|uniref:uncharacterized protein n=1 Tax=Penaeus vannamei TaxID=6689 RepID=UPI00387F7D8E